MLSPGGSTEVLMDGKAPNQMVIRNGSVPSHINHSRKHVRCVFSLLIRIWKQLHGILHQVIMRDTRDGYSKEMMFTPQTVLT
jgi:hypothetical protein